MEATKGRIKPTVRTGRIIAISVSFERGTKKVNVPEAQLQVGLGIVGDAHAGNWHRQISLLSIESINKMLEKGLKVFAGDFAENITTQGVDLNDLKVGDKLKLSDGVMLEITQVGKRCRGGCEIFKQIGDCIMPREGIFAIVIEGGTINVGDTIVVIDD